MFLNWFRNALRRQKSPTIRRTAVQPTLEMLESRLLPSSSPIGDVFVILMENHNWTQPSTYTAVPQIEGSASAPYINSTLTQIGAYANNYENAAVGDHPLPVSAHPTRDNRYIRRRNSPCHAPG